MAGEEKISEEMVAINNARAEPDRTLGEDNGGPAPKSLSMRFAASRAIRFILRISIGLIVKA